MGPRVLECGDLPLHANRLLDESLVLGMNTLERVDVFGDVAVDDE